VKHQRIALLPPKKIFAEKKIGGTIKSENFVGLFPEYNNVVLKKV